MGLATESLLTHWWSAFPSTLTSGGGASPLLMTGHRQVIGRISKGSQNILIYTFIISTFDCHGGFVSARAFALARPPMAQPLGLHKPMPAPYEDAQISWANQRPSNDL